MNRPTNLPPLARVKRPGQEDWIVGASGYLAEECLDVTEEDDVLVFLVRQNVGMLPDRTGSPTWQEREVRVAKSVVSAAIMLAMRQ